MGHDMIRYLKDILNIPGKRVIRICDQKGFQGKGGTQGLFNRPSAFYQEAAGFIPHFPVFQRTPQHDLGVFQA